ncbi:MAG TPA: metal-dependent hydrolase [Thermopetrobacter sp.]|nr:metal-dependent hydrolase [Thermopetrobacter sp.]
MKLTWFGHSAFRVDVNGARILIDPFLSGNPSWEGDVETAAEGATHVIVTHGHDDHLGDAKDICARTGAVLISSFEVCMYVGAERMEPMNTGGRITLEGFDVALTPALHSSSHEGHDLGPANGVVILPHASGARPLYHAGDTGLFSDMKLIEELYRPRVGLIPIGDRFTMGPHTAALACRKFFDFDLVVPMHWGSFPIIEQTPDNFLAEMGAMAEKVRVMKPGETITVQ